MRTLILPALLIAAPAAAHPVHDEEAHSQAPAEVARQHVVRMVTQSKLAPSWSEAKVEGTAQRTANGARQTVVTFTNPSEPVARRTLHVVIGADGKVVSANPSAS